MCDMTHSHVWHDSFTSHMTHSHVWHNSFTCVTWLIHMCDMTHSHAWDDTFTCVTWLIYACDITHSYVWRGRNLAQQLLFIELFVAMTTLDLRSMLQRFVCAFYNSVESGTAGSGADNQGTPTPCVRYICGGCTCIHSVCKYLYKYIYICVGRQMWCVFIYILLYTKSADILWSSSMVCVRKCVVY